MANKRDINDVTDEISLIMREVVEVAENNMQFEIANALNEDLTQLKDANDFLRRQASKKRALENTLRKVAFEAQQQQINIAKNIGTYAGINTAPLEEEIKRGSSIVLASSKQKHDDQVKKIYRLNKFVTSAQYVPDLRKSIIEETQKGIDQSIPVTFKNGRKVGYREYMEMAVRTGIQQEIGQQQIEIAKEANIVFFLCDEYADCADDHADYQGKIYYNADYRNFNLREDAKDMIANAIRVKGYQSIQEVRDGDPYLTTRPNCRHRFIPISIDEAISEDLRAVKTSVDSVRGNYRPENYEDLKQQRAFERNIRNSKSQLETFEKLKAKNGNTKEYDAVMLRIRAKINRQQAGLRELLQRNPALSRERRRETRKILIKDFGTKYKLKTDPEKPPTPVNNPPTTPQPANVVINETIEKHYAMPEEKKVYIKKTYDIGWSKEAPSHWKRASFGHQELFERYKWHLEEKDQQFEDDEKYPIRKLVTYLHKAQDKHFNFKIKLGEGSHFAGTIELKTLDREEKYRLIETVTHELGHGFDYQIAGKLGFTGGNVAISSGRRAYEWFNKKVMNQRGWDAQTKRLYIERKEKELQDTIDNMTPEQREVFEAGDSFTNAIQKQIKTKKTSSLLETDTYKRVKAFDTERRSISTKVYDELGISDNEQTKWAVIGGLVRRKLNNQLPEGYIDSLISGGTYSGEELKTKFAGWGIDINKLKNDKYALDLLKQAEDFDKEYRSKKLMADQKIKEKTSEFNKNNIHMSQTSDFLDALSLGKLRSDAYVSYGHGTRYYKPNAGEPEAEIFTHLQTLNTMAPDEYNLLKKDFPEICEAFEKIMEKTVNYLINKEGVAKNE